jgi:hypothetical protein
MSTKRRVLAFLLLGVVTSPFLSAYSVSVPIKSTEQSAPCHRHNHPLPSPEPFNHECCRAGHQAAILPEFYKPRPSLESTLTAAVAEKEFSIGSPRKVSYLPLPAGERHSNPPLRV